MRISVIGTGYVGLVTGTCLAEVGHEVMCLDTDLNKISLLKKGIIPIHEPGLQELVVKNAARGLLKFTTNPEESVRFADIQIIAVGTPPGEDGSADMQYVLSAAREIAKWADSYKLVINKSTVPVGTAKKVRDEIKKHKANLDFDVVSNPEFLKEGAAVADCMRPDRIILGVESERPVKTLQLMYEPFQRNHDKIIVMDCESSELTKYAANAMLATRISFMNELSRLCDATGAHIESVRKGIGSDPRIGYDFLYAGLGYGGSCFPKDVKALIHTGKENKIDLEILQSVESANAKQRQYFLNKILNHFNQNLTGLNLALWGLAFKPNTDDLREAPSLFLIEKLLKAGASLRLYDPVAMTEMQKWVVQKFEKDNHRIHFCQNQNEAIQNADALILVTEWNDFKNPDLHKLKQQLKQPVVFDGRNIYGSENMKKHGFTYYGLGV